MKYEVISAEEAEKKNFVPWESGIYDFTILNKVSFGTKIFDTKEATSSKGNPMLNLVVKIFAKDGSDYERHILDNVMLTGAMLFKFRHLADACGLTEKYEAGTLTAEDLWFKSGKCMVDIQPETPKDKNNPSGDKYPAKNIITDYIPRGTEVSKGELDDAIPF